MELRDSAGVNWGPSVEYKETRRSNQTYTIHAPTHVFLPSFQSQVLGYQEDKGRNYTSSSLTYWQLSKANIRWVRLGCSLLTTLLSSPEGVRYLGTEDHLLPQIVKSFDQLDPVSPHSQLAFLPSEHLNQTVQWRSRLWPHILQTKGSRYLNIWILRNAWCAEQA